MTFRTGWIIAVAIALALVAGAAAYSQQTDAQASASKAEATASASQDTDAQSSASQKEDAQASASKADGQSGASRKAGEPFTLFRLYDFVKGPLFYIALAVFALGFAWRILTLRRATRPVRAGPLPLRSVPAPAPSSAADDAFLMKGMPGISRLAFRVRRWIRRTVFATTPVMGVVSLLFHVGLFLVPLLLPAHNVLIRQSIGVALPTLPEPLLDRLTLVLLVIGGFFLLRRIFFPRVRALSTVRDYLVLLLVASPFLTAYASYHQWLDYRTIVVLHMMNGELVIALIPFTKIGHMPFLIFSRFFLSAERSWRPATRRW